MWTGWCCVQSGQRRFFFLTWFSCDGNRVFHMPSLLSLEICWHGCWRDLQTHSHVTNLCLAKGVQNCVLRCHVLAVAVCVWSVGKESWIIWRAYKGYETVSFRLARTHPFVAVQSIANVLLNKNSEIKMSYYYLQQIYSGKYVEGAGLTTGESTELTNSNMSTYSHTKHMTASSRASFFA